MCEMGDINMCGKKLNIEFIRIFSIFMTIIIHVSNVYIYSFHNIEKSQFLTSVIFNSFSRICVPLFFMISGAFTISKQQSNKKYIHRIIKFILVLIIWSFIYYVQKNGFYFENFKIVLVNSFFNANMTSRHLWYMYAFIGINIALPFIQNMCKNITLQQENLFLTLWITLSGITVIIIPLASEILEKNVNISYPVPIFNASYYLGYFISGHLIYKRFENVKFNFKKNILCILIFGLSTSITSFFTYYLSVKNNQLFDDMFWYKSIFTIFATFSIFILFIVNKNIIKSEKILLISKHTFGIYLIHIVFLNIIKNNYNILEYNSVIAIPLLSLVIFVLSLVSCCILSKIPYVNKIIF